MEIVITAKGKAFRTDMVAENPSPERLYIRITDASLAAVAAVFGDRMETAVITYGSRILTKYTRLVAIMPEADAVKVILGKE